MKTWRRIQKAAVIVGMTYGLWLGANVGATGADTRNGLMIVVLSVVIALSLLVPADKEQEKSL